MATCLEWGENCERRGKDHQMPKHWNIYFAKTQHFFVISFSLVFEKLFFSSCDLWRGTAGSGAVLPSSGKDPRGNGPSPQRGEGLHPGWCPRKKMWKRWHAMKQCQTRGYHMSSLSHAIGFMCENEAKPRDVQEKSIKWCVHHLKVWGVKLGWKMPY